MKRKGLITAVLSMAAACSLATGVAATAIASGDNAQSRKTNGNQAYFVNKEASTVEYGQDNNSNKNGIKAMLAPEDQLTLCNVVNLQEMYDKGESFLEIAPIVQEVGKADYKRIMIEIIDVYDETNYLKIQINAAPQLEDTATIAYFLAGASNGQKLTGYEASSGKLHVNNEYGEYSVFAFGDTIAASSGTGFFYDVEKNAMFTVDYRGIKKQIIDFDDPVYFGTYLWDGFTSNEVYCRIKCDDYRKEQAGILVTKYGDTDLSNDKIHDKVAPALTVNYGEYTKDTIPSALINTPYRVFPATSFDAVDGSVNTSVKVYMNYYSTSRISVSVKNGAFTPKAALPHHIVYTTTDSRGNEKQEVVAVNVVNRCEDLTLNFDEIVDSCVKGNAYVLPDYTIQGALGNATVTVTATLNGEEIAIENNRVRPYASGTMKLSYKAEDYVARTYEIEHTITVENATRPTFIEEPILPKNFIAGNSYTLPALNAYNYVTAEGAVLSTSIYAVENGEEKAVENGVYIPSNVTETEIVYRVKIGDAVNEYRYKAPVYNVRNDDGLDMSKYFLASENGNVSARFDGVDLVSTGNARFEYVNYVTAVSAKTEFMIGTNPKAVEKLHIYLTDIADRSKVVKFTYTFTGEKSTFYVNDKASGAVELSSVIEPEKMYSVIFDATGNRVFYDIESNNVLSVKNYLNGEAFNGFTNGRAYVSYEMEGVKEEATICIVSMNSNYFSDDTSDWIAPLIDFLGNVGGEYEVGETLVLPTVIANDVLDGDVNAYITVKSPSGEIVTTLDGKRLENFRVDGSKLEVKLEEYGSYLMTVYTKDSWENETTISSLTWVVDTVEPTFTLNGEIVSTAKVGQKVSVPTVKATDNFSKNTTVRVYVMMPGGTMVDVTNNKGFVANDAGVYTIVYYVTDDAGNFASANYYVTVA